MRHAPARLARRTPLFVAAVAVLLLAACDSAITAPDAAPAAGLAPTSRLTTSTTTAGTDTASKGPTQPWW